MGDTSGRTGFVVKENSSWRRRKDAPSGLRPRRVGRGGWGRKEKRGIGEAHKTEAEALNGKSKAEEGELVDITRSGVGAS